MASPSSLRRRELCDSVGFGNQVPALRSGFTFLCGGVLGSARGGHGKAQSSLEKIINVIASCKAGEACKETAAERGVSVSSSEDLSCGRSGFGLDLNLGVDENEVEFSIGAVRIGDSDVHVIGGQTDAVGAISISEDGDEEEDGAGDRRVEEKNRVGGGGRGDKDDGYLSLLIEAAQVVSGQFRDDDEEEEEEVGPSWRDVLGSELVRNSGESDSNGYGLVRESQRLKISSQRKAQVDSTTNNTKLANNESWMMEELYEDISPVVKSKRGRTQVLPYRFRDSVIEPWSSITPGKRRFR